MAVVKIDFCKKGRHERKNAKENIKYIENRPGKDKAKIQRPLFNEVGLVTRLEGYEMVNHAPEGSTFFRIKISPDPVKENAAHDLPMREITKEIMALEAILGTPISWVGAIHDDHTNIAHVHVLAVTKARKLPAREMIRTATDACLEQRRELDKTLQPEREQEKGGEGRIWERERSK